MNTVKETYKQNVQRAKHGNMSASQEGPQTTATGQGPPQESTQQNDQGIKRNPKSYPPLGATSQVMKAPANPRLPSPEQISLPKGKP